MTKMTATRFLSLDKDAQALFLDTIARELRLKNISKQWLDLDTVTQVTILLSIPKLNTSANAKVFFNPAFSAGLLTYIIPRLIFTLFNRQPLNMMQDSQRANIELFLQALAKHKFLAACVNVKNGYDEVTSRNFLAAASYKSPTAPSAIEASAKQLNSTFIISLLQIAREWMYSGDAYENAMQNAFQIMRKHNNEKQEFIQTELAKVNDFLCVFQYSSAEARLYRALHNSVPKIVEEPEATCWLFPGLRAKTVKISEEDKENHTKARFLT